MATGEKKRSHLSLASQESTASTHAPITQLRRRFFSRSCSTSARPRTPMSESPPTKSFLTGRNYLVRENNSAIRSVQLVATTENVVRPQSFSSTNPRSTPNTPMRSHSTKQPCHLLERLPNCIHHLRSIERNKSCSISAIAADITRQSTRMPRSAG